MSNSQELTERLKYRLSLYFIIMVPVLLFCTFLPEIVYWQFREWFFEDTPFFGYDLRFFLALFNYIFLAVFFTGSLIATAILTKKRVKKAIVLLVMAGFVLTYNCIALYAVYDGVLYHFDFFMNLAIPFCMIPSILFLFVQAIVHIILFGKLLRKRDN